MSQAPGNNCDRRAAHHLPDGRAVRSTAIYPERSVKPTSDIVLSSRASASLAWRKNITFEIRAGEVVGLAGLMGIRSIGTRSNAVSASIDLPRGKSASTAACRSTPATAMAAGVAFLTEDRRGEGLVMDFTIAEKHGARFRCRRSPEHSAGRSKEIAPVAAEMAARCIFDGQGRRNDGQGTCRAATSRRSSSQMASPPASPVHPRRADAWHRTSGRSRKSTASSTASLRAEAPFLLISSEIEELIGLSDRILTITAANDRQLRAL